MKFGGPSAFRGDRFIVLRLRRTTPAVLAATVVALAAGCSWIQPSNRVLAEQGQGQSTSPSDTASPSASAPVAGALPAWATALGAGVVVTAPEPVAPGHDAPGAAVQGYVSAVNAGSLIRACSYYPPSARAICRATVARVSPGTHPAMQDFALGYVAVDGNEALVGTNRMCPPGQTPACASNDDPAAIFSQAKTFPELWAESLAADVASNTNSYSLAPCVKIGRKWFIYNPGPGGNT
jgi:hypothetical protein